MDVDVATLLQFRPMVGSDEDLSLFQRCFNANGQPRSLDGLRWQFLAPPAHRLYVNLAVENVAPVTLAAIYATVPLWMKVGDRRVLGLQSLDTLTDARFRGKGLFVRMARAMYERCAADGVELVYGFPNGNSAHGFFTKLGWTTLDPVPHLLKPLRLRYVTSKLKFNRGGAPRLDLPLTFAKAPRLHIGEELRNVSTFDAEFDALWRLFAGKIGVAVERDSAYLSWRVRRPGENYETIALLAQRALRGYVILGNNEVAGARIGKVMELIFDPSDERIGAVLLAETVRRLYERGCDAVWALSFEHSPNRAALRRAGFISPPARISRSEIHFGARSLGAASSELLARRSSWYVSLLDSDTH